MDTVIENLSRKRKRHDDTIIEAQNSLKKWNDELSVLDEKLEIMREAQEVAAELSGELEDSSEEI